MTLYIAGYTPESITEGDGVRAVVYVSGCRHRCPGCFNVAGQSFTYGEPFTDDKQREIIADIAANPLIDGVTLCGGDPFFLAADCAVFIRRFREACPGKTVWAYSGFTIEEIAESPEMAELLALCDVLIDGRYVESERDLTLKYRGSRNQRIIHFRPEPVSNVI
jgi:anaerobic ribonucleoside-triphosphate reductase activating protein